MKRPFFIFLLPVFFVLHGYVENFRSIEFMDCLPLIALYLGITGVIFLLFLLLFKNGQKAALMTFFIMSFYFFFGALHDFLIKNNIFLHKYSLILPLFLLTGILLFLYLRNKQGFTRACLFLNCLLIVYILVDAVTLARKYRAKSDIAGTYASPTGLVYNTCNDCPRPDIYFLLFDEYTNSRTLKNIYGYDNSVLDSFLLKEGFHIQVNSRSNYNFTVFSMASLFNMSYLHIRDPDNVLGEDYTDMLNPHRTEEAIQYLASIGYSISNNSAFDLPGRPSSVNQPFILAKTKLITNRTLIDHMVRDIGLFLKDHFEDRSVVIADKVAEAHQINQKMFAQTLEESGKISPKPRFVYMHVFMPHSPHMYDSLQRLRKFDEVDRGGEAEKIHEYLNYLPYTNARVKEVISTIKRNTNSKAVIIFMSDHGMRYSQTGHGRNPYCFDNQNAIYLPEKDYRLFYDSMTAVNEFRVVFNKLFRQHIPLLKDSTVLLKINK